MRINASAFVRAIRPRGYGANSEVTVQIRKRTHFTEKQLVQELSHSNIKSARKKCLTFLVS